MLETIITILAGIYFVVTLSFLTDEDLQGKVKLAIFWPIYIAKNLLKRLVCD